MKSDVLALFKQKNGWYTSTKISKKTLEEMCNNYFRIVVGKNPYKKEGDTRPEMVMFVIGDKNERP